MRCVILSACPVSPELKRLLRPDDFIIACDAGYRNCAPLGCKPNIILGDFDTAPCPVQQNDDIIVLPHVKDDTDTEYAARLASEEGFTEGLLLWALCGRRIEQTRSSLDTGLLLEELGFQITLTCLEKPNFITRKPACLYGINRYNRFGNCSTAEIMRQILPDEK